MTYDKFLAYNQAVPFKELIARSVRVGDILRSRYDETRLGPQHQIAFNRNDDVINILALVTEDDPDTLAVAPIIARLIDASPRVQLRFLCDEEDLAPLAVLAPELDLVGILEEWDLPQFLLFDEDWDLQAQWGPRPIAAEAQVEDWLSRHPEYEALAEDESSEGQERYAVLAQHLVYEMRIWYNSGLTYACLDEWLDLLRSVTGEELPVSETESA
jgi:hypothetical protein